MEICAQNQGNSISGDLKCKNFLQGGMPPDPLRRDHLRRSIITIRLLRNFCQLLEKLWTTLCDILGIKEWAQNLPPPTPSQCGLLDQEKPGLNRVKRNPISPQASSRWVLGWQGEGSNPISVFNTLRTGTN